MDVLDAVLELKREGLIRSVGGESMPSALIKESEALGFGYDSIQGTCNVLDQRFLSEMQPFWHENNMIMLASSTLAGGLLSEQFYNLKQKDLLFPQLTARQKFHTKTIHQWAKGNDSGMSPWQLYEKHILRVIGEISLKHRVPLASVAMRWVVQQDGVGSALIRTAVGRIDRTKELRNVFSFELDDDDLQAINDARNQGILHGNSGSIPATPSLADMMNNRKLWL